MILVTDANLLGKLQEVEGPAYTEVLWVDGDIYGLGGWNRYYINNQLSDGELRFETFEPNEIVFSLYHARSEDIPKAEKAGFRVFD